MVPNGMFQQLTDKTKKKQNKTLSILWSSRRTCVSTSGKSNRLHHRRFESNRVKSSNFSDLPIRLLSLFFLSVSQINFRSVESPTAQTIRVKSSQIKLVHQNFWLPYLHSYPIFLVGRKLEMVPNGMFQQLTDKTKKNKTKHCPFYEAVDAHVRRCLIS